MKNIFLYMGEIIKTKNDQICILDRPVIDHVKREEQNQEEGKGAAGDRAANILLTQKSLG